MHSKIIKYVLEYYYSFTKHSVCFTGDCQQTHAVQQSNNNELCGCTSDHKYFTCMGEASMSRKQKFSLELALVSM